MSKGKISVVIKNTVPPANDKLSQQWQKKKSKIASPPVFFLWCHAYSVSRTCSSQSMSFNFFCCWPFHFISFLVPALPTRFRRANIDYSFLATYVGIIVVQLLPQT